MPIQRYNEFNPTFENISFGDVKTSPSGAKSVYVSMNGEQLTIQSPKMYVPYGVNRSKYGEPGSQNGRPTLEVSFRNISNDDKLKLFHSKIKAFEEIIKNGLKSCSQSWMKKKKLSSEMINEIFKSGIRQSRDENGEPNDKFPDTFRLKLKTNEENVVLDHHLQIYNRKTKKLMNLDEFTKSKGLKGYEIKFIAKVSGIWIGSANIGCNWIVSQISVYPNDRDARSYGFINTSDEEEEDEDEDEDEDEEKMETEIEAGGCKTTSK